jgi:PKD repeat protein
MALAVSLNDQAAQTAYGATHFETPLGQEGSTVRAFAAAGITVVVNLSGGGHSYNCWTGVSPGAAGTVYTITRADINAFHSLWGIYPDYVFTQDLTYYHAGIWHFSASGTINDNYSKVTITVIDRETRAPIAGATIGGTVASSAVTNTTDSSGSWTGLVIIGVAYTYYVTAAGYTISGQYWTPIITENYSVQVQLVATGYVPPYKPVPVPPIIPSPLKPLPIPIPDPPIPPGPFPDIPPGPFPDAPYPDYPLPEGWGVCNLYIFTYYMSGGVVVPISGATVVVDSQTLTSDSLGYSYINVYYDLTNGTYYQVYVTKTNFKPQGWNIKVTYPTQILYAQLGYFVPQFSGTPITGNTTITTAFTDTTCETPTSWDWDYGDGTAHGTTHNPSHVYNDGTFSVTLSVTYASKGATTYSLTKTAYINVTKPITPPPTPTPIDKISGGNNPGDGTIVYQLNSVSSAEDVGSKYEHLMTLQALTNYDLLDSPNYVVFPYTAINLVAKTITYASGTWTTNCYAGMVLMVTADSGKGVRCYGVVASNTGTVITMSTFMYETDIPATGFFIVHKGYNVDFMVDISEPTAIENYDVNVDCFEFSDNDDKRKLSTRIVATGKDVFGKTISVMVDAPHAFDATRQFFNDSTVVRKRSEGYVYKNNYISDTASRTVTGVINSYNSTPDRNNVDTTLITINPNAMITSFPVNAELWFEIGGGGVIPTELTAFKKYYVVYNDTINNIKIANAPGGTPIALVSANFTQTVYIRTNGGLAISNTDNFISSGQQFIVYGTTAPSGLNIGQIYTNNSPTYSSAIYFINCNVLVASTGTAVKICKTSDVGNLSELGLSPVVWLYGWQYTIPIGSVMSFSIPNSGVDGIQTVTTSLPQEFSSSNNLLLTQIHLSVLPTTDFSGKGYLLNRRLYVGEKTPIGNNQVLIGEEKITVATVGTDTVYGDWIQFADVTKRVTSSTLKCYPHDVGALVARTNYTAASPEPLSPIAEHKIIIDNRTVDGQITYGALDTYASSLLLGFGQFYQIATTWSPMIYGIVPHVGKVSDGTPESNRYRLIQAADRISFTKFSGETAVEYETVAITIKCDEGRILLNLGDFEKNPYTTMIAGTNAINRPLS